MVGATAAGISQDYGAGRGLSRRIGRSTSRLAGNRNDKGTMFGGSVYSAMVLAGWLLSIEQGQAAGRSGDIVIKDSSIAFLRPVTGRLIATATPAGAPAETRHGNLAFRIRVVADDEQGERCAEFEGNYRLLAATAEAS